MELERILILSALLFSVKAPSPRSRFECRQRVAVNCADSRTFVVNIGNMLSYLSNDTFASAVHRVLNITGEDRYSISFFMGSNYETLGEPLEHRAKE